MSSSALPLASSRATQRSERAELAGPLAGFAALSLPLLFILLWSSGYVAGRLGLPHSGPFTLLTLRFGIAALVLLAVALLGGAPWPRGARAWGHLVVAGLLMQGLHFAGVYYGLRLGLSAGVSGLLGVALVMAGKPLAGGGAAYAAALLGLAGLVAGTLYQKRFCAGMDLRSGSAVQMGVSALAVAALAGPVEGFALDWSLDLVFAVLWLSLVNSIGAFSLMFLMIRRGRASQVAGLFFLIPGVSAAMGFVLLGERLPTLALLGFALSALAVFFASASTRR